MAKTLVEMINEIPGKRCRKYTLKRPFYLGVACMSPLLDVLYGGQFTKDEIIAWAKNSAGGNVDEGLIANGIDTEHYCSVYYSGSEKDRVEAHYGYLQPQNSNIKIIDDNNSPKVITWFSLFWTENVERMEKLAQVEYKYYVNLSKTPTMKKGQDGGIGKELNDFNMIRFMYHTKGHGTGLCLQGA